MGITVKDLREEAKKIGIRNCSNLKKHELLYVLAMHYENQHTGGGALIEELNPLDNERRRANSIERYYHGIYD
jgi:hypothetical protein